MDALRLVVFDEVISASNEHSSDTIRGTNEPCPWTTWHGGRESPCTGEQVVDEELWDDGHGEVVPATHDSKVVPDTDELDEERVGETGTVAEEVELGGVEEGAPAGGLTETRRGRWL